MKTLLSVVAIAATITLTGCDKKEAPAAPAPAAATAPAQAAAPAQPTIPADDPTAIAAMSALAKQAATTNPDDQNATTDGIIDGPFNPSGQNLQAGKPRADGYPNYAVMCAVAKDVCTQVNGTGQYLDSSIESLGNAITVMRNADVLSGKYTCGHGICTDAQKSLVGRISPAMLQRHPELAH